MDAAPCLEARGLGYTRDRREILKGIDLTLRPGDLMAVVGPNGAGKSSLLRCLSGVWEPTSGEVELAGRPLSEWSRRDVACRLAFLPQLSEAPVDVDVREAVAQGRYPHASPWKGSTAADRDAVEAAMATMGLKALARRRLPTLSGGERQRVRLARSLVQEATIVLLDEPTAALDIGHQLELIDLFRELVGRGHALLVAIHDLHLVHDVFPRVLLLDRGRALIEGAPRDVLLSEELGAAFGVSCRLSSDGALHMERRL